MRIAALLALASLAPQENADAFWKFKPGTVLTYAVTEGGVKKKSVTTVQKEEEGKVWLEEKETAEGEAEPTIKTLAYYVKDGFVVYAEKVEGKLVDKVRLLKVGSKKGDSWKNPAGDELPEFEIQHLGTEEVKAAAGTWKDAIHLRFKLGGDADAFSAVADYWMAPGAGLVKFLMKAADQEVYTLELKELKAPK